MSRSEWIEPPEVYTFIPLRTQKYVKCSNKKYILYIIFGCLLLLIITSILFKSLYHQKQTTTMTKKIVVLTTTSTLRNQGEIVQSIYYFVLKFIFFQKSD